MSKVEQKNKVKKAVRELRLDLKIEVSSYENSIRIEVGDIENEDGEKYTEKQLHDIAVQLVEKFNNTKVTLLSAIKCPNCGTKLDETDEKNVYHCTDCNCTINLEFQKK